MTTCLPTPEELTYLKTKWKVYGHGIDFGHNNVKEIIIDKLEKGWDVKKFYEQNISIVYLYIIMPFILYFTGLAMTGIVLSKNDCQPEYCYNVNQYLWAYYGCVCFGYYFILFIAYTCTDSGGSEFMKYFLLSFSNMSYLYFSINNSISLVILGSVVNIIYLYKSDYLQPLLITSTVINICSIKYVTMIKDRVNKNAFDPIVSESV